MSHNEEKYLGKGGFGSVYLKPCGKIVVKYSNEKHPNEKTKELFKRECHVLEKLKHPNIIAYLGIQEKDEQGNDKFGILLEYCERQDLERLIFNPKWVYTMKWAITGAEQLFEALDYLWQNKLTHRDIKPSNIFVKENFLLKLGDFGTVREIEKTSTGTFDSGTLRYLPPPQFENNHENPELDQRMVSHKNDVYSLGLTIWEMIERRLAFDEYIHTDSQGEKSFNRERFTIDVQQKRLIEIQWKSSLRYLSIGLSPLVSSCTSFNRERRPNARQVLEDFQESREEDEILEHPDQLPMESNEPNLIRPILFVYHKGSRTWQQEKYKPISTDADPIKWLYQDPQFLLLYDPLSAVNKKDFDTKLPQIIYDMGNKIFLFHESQKLEGEADQLLLVNDIFAYAREYLMKLHLNHLRKIANLINEHNYCTTNFLPWHNYEEIGNLISSLEGEQARMLSNKNLSFKLFFSLSTKAKEFLLFENDSSKPVLLKSDFTQRPRKGEWVSGTEKKICLLGDEEFELSEMTKTMDIAEILTLLEKVKNGIERQTKYCLSKFVSSEESETRTIQIFDQELRNKLKDDYILFQLRNPPRPPCIHKPNCNLRNFENLDVSNPDFLTPFLTPFLISETPDELAISVDSAVHHRADDCDDVRCPCCRPDGAWFGKLQLWTSGCDVLTMLYNDMDYHGVEMLFLHTHSCPNYLIFLQVVKRDENGAKYLTLLDHPINYEPYEKIWCLDKSSHLEEIHVSKIQQWIKEMKPEERRYLSYKGCEDHIGNPDDFFQTLDQPGNMLPKIHHQFDSDPDDQLETMTDCSPSPPKIKKS